MGPLSPACGLGNQGLRSGPVFAKAHSLANSWQCKGESGPTKNRSGEELWKLLLRSGWQNRVGMCKKKKKAQQSGVLC